MDHRQDRRSSAGAPARRSRPYDLTMCTTMTIAWKGPIQAVRTGWRRMVRIFAVSVSATSDR
jgi:hypothetical protein